MCWEEAFYFRVVEPLAGGRFSDFGVSGEQNAESRIYL